MGVTQRLGTISLLSIAALSHLLRAVANVAPAGQCPGGEYGYSKSCQGGYYLSNDNVGGHADALLHSSSSNYPSTLTSSGGGYYVVMQTDGNLVIYTSGNSPIWSSGTSSQGTGPYRLVLQTDGYAHSPVSSPHLVHWHGVLGVACEVMNRIYTAAPLLKLPPCHCAETSCYMIRALLLVGTVSRRIRALYPGDSLCRSMSPESLARAHARTHTQHKHTRKKNIPSSNRKSTRAHERMGILS